MNPHLNVKMVSALAAGLLLAGAGRLPAEPVRVVTTTPVIKSLVESIGGDKVRVTSIGTGAEDPHFIQAKPSFMLLARNADLWVRVGMELEIGYEGLIIDGSRNPKIRPGQPGHLDLSESIIKLDVPAGRVTRDMGDVHPMGNPHYWLDPLNGRLMAKAITERLCQLAPDDAPAFRANAAAFTKVLDGRMFGADLVAATGGDKLWALLLKGRLDQHLADNKLDGRLGGWLEAMRPLAGRKLVTQHKSWIYFTGRFGLVVAGELEAKPGVPPSPAHLADVVMLMKREGIGVILLEPFYERKAADWVAERTGADVVVRANSPGGQKETADYLTMLDNVVDGLAGAMKAKSGTEAR